MNNKVKFLRGTSGEYTAAEKDNDTIYFTTDDGKLYIGDKEVSGSDITIDDTLSDTSTNPVQGNVIKQAIDNKADKTVATTTADGLMSAADKTKLDDAGNTYALKSKYGDTTIDVGRKSGSDVGDYSTAEGYGTTASEYTSHAEGFMSLATGSHAHAEGQRCTASGIDSHAEGVVSVASGNASHAEGCKCTASGECSHAGGIDSIASGLESFAHGSSVKSLKNYEVSFGIWNQSSSDTLFSIGNGTADDARHNAFEITTTGGKLHDKDIATTDDIPDLSPYAKKTDVPNIKVNSAVNADTLGEKSADDFVQIINLGDNQTDTKNAIGSWGKTTIYRCTNWTDFPAESPDGQGIVISMSHGGTGTAGTDPMWVTQFFIPANSGVVYKRHIANTTVYSWCAIYSADNKPYITGSFSGTAASFDFDYAPSFAMVDNDGIMKRANIYILHPEEKYVVSFENLSDTTHQYIIFK